MGKNRKFLIATQEDIISKKTTDVYFKRTVDILSKKKKSKIVKAEFVAKHSPYGDWAVFSGLLEVMELLRDKKVNLYAMPEGTVFVPYEPVMVIEGDYIEFAEYETPLLGFICQASGIATKAARMRKIAEDKTLLSFGARRMHPAISPMIERSAYIGGCDGVSTILAAEIIGEEAKGTMPHSLVLLFEDTVEALKAYHEIVERKIPRIALIDTFLDEKFEAIRVAEKAKEFLYGIRLDTPGSRRGNLKRIIEEIRWEFKIRNLKNVKIFVSGGIDEEEIFTLRDVVDGFGVGTSLSNAKAIDFAMDIVEIEQRPIAKRGKRAGAKNVFICQKCTHRRIGSLNEKPGKCKKCKGKEKALLELLIKNGKVLKSPPKPQDIREYVISQLKENLPGISWEKRKEA